MTNEVARLLRDHPEVFSLEAQRRVDELLSARAEPLTADQERRFIAAVERALTPGPPHSCGTWPYPSSDLDLVLPEENAATHIARGCCAKPPPPPPSPSSEGSSDE